MGSAIRFDLALDAIDADRYLPPASEAETGAADSSAGENPLAMLGSLDVDGQLKVGKLKVNNLNASDISVTMKGKDGVLNIAPITANLYQGTFAGKIGINATGAQPKLSVDEKLIGIQVGPLLKDLQGAESLSGRGDIEAKMTAVGSNAEAMKKTLNGTAAFVFADGSVSGFNIAEMIRDAKAMFLGGSESSSDAPKKTDFSELTGSFVVKDGLVTNNDLSAKSPLLRLDGKGTADLPTETIDYHVTTTLVATTQGQGGDELADLAGIPIPIKIGGTFSEPSYGLDIDMGALLQSKAGDLLEGGAEGLIEGVSGGAEGLIEGVSGGAEGLIEGVSGGAEGLIEGVTGGATEGTTGESGSAVEKAADLLKGGDDKKEGGLLEGLLGN